MQHPYATLQADYQTSLARMQITRLSAIQATAERLISYIDAGKYDAGCKATGVPVAWAAASFERESSSNFKTNPAQGWPLNSRSQWVPHNGPFSSWTDAQIAAYQIDGLDKVGAANWTWARACYEGEAFNGFGPRAHGIHTGYLWAGTSIYGRGKYVEDGVWSATTVDEQLGIVPMIWEIVRTRPATALADPFPAAIPSPPIVPGPQPAPAALQDAAALQTALNTLGADPKLGVDDNFGRMTRAAVIAFQKKAGLQDDGIAGPATWAAIDAALKGAQHA